AGGAHVRVRRPRGHGRVRARVPRSGRRDADVAVVRSDRRADPRSREAAGGARRPVPDRAHVRGLGTPGCRPGSVGTTGSRRADIPDLPSSPGQRPGSAHAARAAWRRHCRVRAPTDPGREPGGARRVSVVRLGRIGYINCYPVYGAIDRGVTPLAAELVTGTPSELNDLLAAGELDLSVVSAVEYARHARDYILLLAARHAYPHRYDLGEEWKRWTGLPFVFAIWAARRAADQRAARAVHHTLLAARDWGLAHLDLLAVAAARATGVGITDCRSYLAGLDYA